MPMMGSPFGGADIFTIVTTIFWIWMLVDCILNKKIRGGSKVGWLIFIFFTQIVGAVVYYFLECKQRNPIEALHYYYQQFAGASRPTPPPYVPPQRPAAPMYMPPAETYTDYTGGYRAQEPLTSEESPQGQPAQKQPEYEQPIITYPEMPTQQHQ